MTKIGVFHEFFSVGLCSLLDGVGQLAEAREDALDVSTILHGNDAALVFLITPAQHCQRCGQSVNPN